MSDDLLSIYETTVSEGGDSDVDSALPQNANVHLGDDDVSSDVETDDSEVDSSEDIESDDVEADIEDDDTPDDVFDFDSIKDKSVAVTVNGETFEVPLSELRNGYMRQSDYTRKTQQVAAETQTLQWAREMQEAFRVDPAGSIRYLQEQFGLLNEPDPYEDLDPEIKPIVSELKRTQQELAVLRQQQEQVNQSRLNAEVQTELESMQSKFADFDPLQVLPIAIENSLSMEKAYKLWKADRFESESAAQAAARAKAEAAASKRESVRKASQKISKGNSRVSAEVDDSWKQFDSFEDIFAYEVEKTR